MYRRSRQLLFASLFSALGFALPLALAAQDTSLAGVDSSPRAIIPADPAVTIGTLPNGLRYYIRENRRPEKRAELRLVVNAGSILEDDDQRGLAHLVEHMAFSGTKHFAKQELVDYLESIGMRFGADVNASTSFDETTYMLTLPTDSAAVLEKGVQILEDWAHNVSFDPKEVARERGVVHEEWRLGRGAGARMRDKQFPILFRGSRYAVRLPIGDMNVVDHATPEQLRRFYTDWYRPDLMAVVAVGDFDARQVERSIRDHFSAIPAATSPRQRTVYPVPDHAETYFAIATDPEATSTSVSVLYEQAVREQKTVAAFREQLVEQLYNGMFNERLSELTQKPDAPFLGASSSQGRLIRSKEAYAIGASVKDNGVERGLGALLTEAERVDRFGFTTGELDREKSDLLRGVEREYAEREKTNSAQLAEEYVRAFTEDDAIPGIGYEYALTRALLPGISLEEVNRLAREWITDRNRVVLVNAPQKDSTKVPDRNALLAVFDSVKNAQITPYRDALADVPLVAHPPAPAKIVSDRVIEELGVTEWRLSNGVRVLLKPTDFKNDEVVFRAYSPGGTSLAPTPDYIPASTAATVVRVGGAGPFNMIDLQKKLAGKVVGAAPFIGELEEGFTGGGSPKDLEPLFQLVYLYCTAPREDSSAFLAYQARLEQSLANRSANPASALQDTVQVTLTQHHPRARPPSSALYQEMNLRKSLAFYRDRFADASDFTFIFVGSFSIDSIRPLVERYLGGLPSHGRKEHWKDVGLRYPTGVIRKTVRRGLEPKAQTQIIFTGPFDFTRENVYAMSALAEVLRIRLRETLRENLGGTYGVGVQAIPTRYPRQEYELRITFGSAPERVTELTKAAFAQIDSLTKVGPTAKDLQKVRETDLRERETDLKQNGYWVSALYSYDFYGWDPRDILKYEQMVQALNGDTIKSAARRYLNERNYVQVSLVPEGVKGSADDAARAPTPTRRAGSP